MIAEQLNGGLACKGDILNSINGKLAFVWERLIAIDGEREKVDINHVSKNASLRNADRSFSPSLLTFARAFVLPIPRKTLINFTIKILNQTQQYSHVNCIFLFLFFEKTLILISVIFNFFNFILMKYFFSQFHPWENTHFDFCDIQFF